MQTYYDNDNIIKKAPRRVCFCENGKNPDL